MSKGKKILSLSSLVVMMLLLVFGCSLLPREDAGTDEGWFIKLRIQDPAASKGITVYELDVTGIAIHVLEPAGEVLQSIDWEKAEGSQEYLVAVPQPGEYRLEVTHFAEREGEPVQATESAAFDIQAMKITVIDLVPGGIGLIWISAPVEGPSDWQLYGTWANEIYNGMQGPAAQIIIYENGIVELYENVGGSTPFETAPFEITSEWTDEQSHWFEAIAYGSAYMLFRILERGNTLEVVTSEVTYYRQ